jgi:hypothetical protein
VKRTFRAAPLPARCTVHRLDDLSGSTCGVRPHLSDLSPQRACSRKGRSLLPRERSRSEPSRVYAVDIGPGGSAPLDDPVAVGDEEVGRLLKRGLR